MTDIEVEKLRITPEYIIELKENEVFVFGSNLSGHHGAGAAKQAIKFGAIYRRGQGYFGNTYAIPTKDHNIETLPIDKIEYYVKAFIQFAKDHPSLKLLVTEIGCGLAGYSPIDIAPLFKGCMTMENVYLPKRFWVVLLGEEIYHSFIVKKECFNMKAEIAEGILRETFYHWDKDDSNSHRIHTYKNIKYKIINSYGITLITFIGTDSIKDIFHYLTVERDIDDIFHSKEFFNLLTSFLKDVYNSDHRIVVSGFSYGGALAQKFYKKYIEGYTNNTYLLSVNSYRQITKNYDFKGLYVYTDNDIISKLFGVPNDKGNVIKLKSPYKWYKFYKNHFYAQSFMVKHLYVTEQLF